MLREWINRPALAAALASLLAGIGGASAATYELMGGGLVFAPVEAVEIEKVDVALALDKIEARYVLRNRHIAERALMVTLPLPSLDMLAIGDEEVAIADRGNSNFTAAAINVDGQSVTPEVEQRAMALGLDVTQEVFRAGLPLFPFAGALPARIEALGDAARLDLTERGILRADDDKLLPAWTLRSTLFWRQTLPPGGAVTFKVVYKPLPGERPFSPEAFDAVRRTHCAGAGLQQSIDRRTVLGKAPNSLQTLSYALATNWGWAAPIGELRITVELPDSKALISTCRDGLKRIGPTTYEWSAKEVFPDDDLHLLIVR